MEGTIKMCVLVLVIFQLHSASSQDLKTIFNCVDSIDEAFVLAKRESKPIMLVVHKNSCGACKRLKPKLRDSQAVRVLSENFIVANAVDGLDLKAEKLGAGYYPCFKYFDQDGKPLPVTNRYNRQYKYYYETAEDLLESMQQAIKLIGRKRH